VGPNAGDMVNRYIITHYNIERYKLNVTMSKVTCRYA
jgi:hypothetical protein